jgi:MsuE subfamily FMN reductase
VIDHALSGRLHLLGISGSRSTPSKSRVAVEAALDFAAGANCDVYTDLVSLDECWLEFCDGRDPSQYRETTRSVIDRIVSADALIVASPIYRGSYTGALKNLFDLIPGDALEGKPVGLIATAGSPHHFLAIEQELKPLMGYFRAIVVPRAVFAHDAHFQDGVLADETVAERLTQLAETVVATARMFTPTPQTARSAIATGR